MNKSFSNSLKLENDTIKILWTIGIVTIRKTLAKQKAIKLL